MRYELPNVAQACNRTDVSDRAVVILINAALKDGHKNIKLIVLTFNYMASCRDYNLEFKFNTALVKYLNDTIMSIGCHALVKYFKLITMHEYLDVMKLIYWSQILIKQYVVYHYSKLQALHGTIDVRWLYDDGGLTVLLPYILSTRTQWSGMASLLSKYRISFNDTVIICDVNKKAGQEILTEFERTIKKY
ncbi:Solute carrier family 12 member 2 [Armadillidium vulgare]|nr:Solute carrier family 12 member 2 [Armadillidium vulgare]